MVRILQMSSSKKHHKLSGGFLFTGMDTLTDLMLDIYSTASNLDQHETITIDCKFSFLDVRVKKMLARFFKAFSKLHLSTNKCSIRVIWNYDFKDEDIEEFGEILAELTDIPFDFVQFDITDEVYGMSAVKC